MSENERLCLSGPDPVVCPFCRQPAMEAVYGGRSQAMRETAILYSGTCGHCGGGWVNYLPGMAMKEADT